MSSKKKNQLKNRQRHLPTQRIVIAAGAAIILIFSGVLIYLQVSVPEQSAAEKKFIIEQSSLPVELNQEKMAIEIADTSLKASNYKIAQPLSLTPKLPAR
jgi:hypothetical protein